MVTTPVVAIIGSRSGAELSDVSKFILALHARQPRTVLLSGGAVGVDVTAERGWLAVGGRVVSVRPKKAHNGYVVERWRLPDGGVDAIPEPVFDDYTSALIYRDLLIADWCERLVAFRSEGRSNGTDITVGFARELGKDVHVYTPRERFAQ